MTEMMVVTVKMVKMVVLVNMVVNKTQTTQTTGKDQKKTVMITDNMKMNTRIQKELGKEEGR